MMDLPATDTSLSAAVPHPFPAWTIISTLHSSLPITATHFEVIVDLFVFINFRYCTTVLSFPIGFM